MSKIDREATQVPTDFWHQVSDQAWDEAAALVAHEFEGFFPQTGEKVSGTASFINFLRRMLGSAQIEIHNRMASYDVWDKTHEVALQIRVESPGNETGKLGKSQFVLAFFTVDRDYLISGASIYFAACGEPHDGRTY